LTCLFRSLKSSFPTEFLLHGTKKITEYRGYLSFLLWVLWIFWVSPVVLRPRPLLFSHILPRVRFTRSVFYSFFRVSRYSLLVPFSLVGMLLSSSFSWPCVACPKGEPPPLFDPVSEFLPFDPRGTEFQLTPNLNLFLNPQASKVFGFGTAGPGSGGTPFFPL